MPAQTIVVSLEVRYLDDAASAMSEKSYASMYLYHCLMPVDGRRSRIPFANNKYLVREALDMHTYYIIPETRNRRVLRIAGAYSTTMH